MIELIINDLLCHNITKDDAILKLRKVIDGLSVKNAYEFAVESFGTSVHDSHTYLQLTKRYDTSNFLTIIKKGTKIDLIIKP